MPPRLATGTDWVLHTQWLCHRLSVTDGRLRLPKPCEVTQLGQTLSSLGVSGTGGAPGVLEQQMKGLGQLLGRLGLRRTRWGREPQHKALPMVGLHPQHGLCLVSEEQKPGSPWLLETPTGRSSWSNAASNWVFCSVALGWREQLELGGLGLAKRVLMRHLGPFLGLLVLTWWVNSVIAIEAWWFSIQFPQPMVAIDGQTLSLLGLGGLISLSLIGLLGVLRRSINRRVAQDLDADLARETFERLLKVRADPHAPNAESLATQLQLFESVRAFAHSALTLLLLDIPFALLFWWVLQRAVGPELGGMVLVYVAIKLVQGALLFWRTRTTHTNGFSAQHDSVSLAMRTIERAEMVKSLDLRSVFLQRWREATHEQLQQNQGVQHLTEIALQDNPGLRQLGFVFWLWFSAHLAAQGSGLSVGTWIGATLLLPLVIHPVSSLPSLCVQWVHAKLALRSIDRIFKLQVDADEPLLALRPEVHTSQVMLQEMKYIHPNQLDDLRIGHWLVKAGERVGIVGDMGGGKSTLLKLLAGLYKPHRGRVLIDQVDVQDLPRDLLSQRVAYLPQNVQIFTGTLRENLLGGLQDVDDTQLLRICQRLGLMAFVNAHAQGLDTPLHEGPHGLSMGQRQLIGLARLVLRDPLIWLLDDPLANLDDGLQQRVLGVLSQSLAPHQTLIVIGHQSALLSMVDRVAVLRTGRLMMDGPRDRIMAQWRSLTSPVN